jgi:GrpB-like predicted nucleotidyltransferase (UPF0157 family)
MPQEELTDIAAQIRNRKTSLTAAARNHHISLKRLKSELAKAGLLETAQPTPEVTIERQPVDEENRPHTLEVTVERQPMGEENQPQTPEVTIEPQPMGEENQPHTLEVTVEHQPMSEENQPRKEKEFFSGRPDKQPSRSLKSISQEELAMIAAQIRSSQTSLTAAARSHHISLKRLRSELAEIGLLEAAPPTAESAFQRLVVRQENGCWIWQGRFKKGSCEFIWKGHGLSARRFAYQLTHSHLPDGEYVYVSCGNPRCVNPAHLYIKKVDLIPYKESWPAEFQALAQHLRQALGDLALRIDHIGSTSLPGLAAKDEIDIQVTVAALDDQVIAAMTALGYTRPDGAWRDHCPPDFNGSEAEWEKLLFCPPEGQHGANIHLRIQGRANQRYALLFRDYLRMHPAAAKAYAELERRLAHILTDPQTYTEVEDPANDLIYLAAEEWAAATHWQAGPCDA